MSRRNTRDSPWTGKKNPGLHVIRFDLSGDKPPSGTTQWMWG